MKQSSFFLMELIDCHGFLKRAFFLVKLIYNMISTFPAEIEKFAGRTNVNEEADIINVLAAIVANPNTSSRHIKIDIAQSFKDFLREQM